MISLVPTFTWECGWKEVRGIKGKQSEKKKQFSVTSFILNCFLHYKAAFYVLHPTMFAAKIHPQKIIWTILFFKFNTTLNCI